MNNSPTKISSLHSLLKFRKIAIVIIASNRLKKLYENYKNSENRKTSSNPLDPSRVMTVFTLSKNEASVSDDLSKIVEAVFNNEARNVSSVQSQEGR